MLVKVPRCAMVSANEGTRTLDSSIGNIDNPASQPSNGSDKLHLKQLHGYRKSVDYYQ